MSAAAQLLRSVTPPFKIPLGLGRSQRGDPMSLHLISRNDEIYEDAILRQPDKVQPWLDYAQFKRQHGTILEQVFVLERAAVALPRSYKLWKMYLDLRVGHLKGRNPARNKAEFHKVNALFERALILLNKMPRIWEMYLTFLCQQPLVTFTRRAFDRALRALPLTQHRRIWSLYRPFANSVGGESAVRVWRRYVGVHPEHMEAYIELLVREQKYVEAVQRYVEMLNNPRFVSKEAKGPFENWADMLEIIIDNARVVPNPIPLPNGGTLNVETLVRSGLKQFPDQSGILWVGLARYYINLGSYEKARDVFEEGITTVLTVRDFSVVFDTYAEAEEALIGIKLEESAARQENNTVDSAADVDLDVRMMRFEQLMDRRPFLVNDVLLRQNPNNVSEWLKRVALWGTNQKMAIQTYTDAIATINPKAAIGRFCDLWESYAQFYESHNDLPSARIILNKAIKVPYKSITELADIYISWAELELRAGSLSGATTLLASATKSPRRSTVSYFDDSLPPQIRIHKSWKLWSYYIDLVESTSPLASIRPLYEKVFSLGIATPQTVVNYALLLESNGYHESSFKIYERGLALFTYPTAFELWNLYLSKAIDRKISIERLRDLFEQALDSCPPKFAKPLYLMYGALEEERGLARHAMRIYERATRSVAPEDAAEMFEYYITKSASNFGLTASRPVYEKAIATLPDKEAVKLCVKFADMERRLGEVDRARGIYRHAAQMVDPRADEGGFWNRWEEFEVRHGNEDTYRDMLRVKRAVIGRFGCDVHFVARTAVERVKMRGQVGFVKAQEGEGGKENVKGNEDEVELEEL
ncbi:protein prenylyltransferase [Piedraia hortae CBS 480.64]|uniref:Pre-mRNA-splicing factor SYF1 n=1 Tax=Piedraia hortae CBS 480.64 TaxID=1314780 RepID=A0A6A7BYS4_9PEZI|nr:protein prenylyltransferase [Piedraia hortae CBS 480.64]